MADRLERRERKKSQVWCPVSVIPAYAEAEAKGLEDLKTEASLGYEVTLCVPLPAKRDGGESG